MLCACVRQFVFFVVCFDTAIPDRVKEEAGVWGKVGGLSILRFSSSASRCGV